MTKFTNRFLSAALGVAFAFGATSAMADTELKFSLDWKYEGPAAPYILAKKNGYYADEGLDVTIDSGNGSVGAITRVASGAYDVSLADINSLVEFNASNPDRAMKSIFMVYDRPPFALFMLKKSGITKPEDLVGKTLGAPVFDASRKLYPAFAEATGLKLDDVKWESMDPPLREPMLVRGDVDAISGHYFTSILNLQAQGIGSARPGAVGDRDGLRGVAIFGHPPHLAQGILNQCARHDRGFGEVTEDRGGHGRGAQAEGPFVALQQNRCDMRTGMWRNSYVF